MLTGRQSRVILTAAIAAILITTIAVATYASAEGRRNTAIGLSVLTGILAAGRHPAPAIITGVGAAVAWQRYAETPRYYYYGRPYYRYQPYGYYPHPHRYGYYPYRWHRHGR